MNPEIWETLQNRQSAATFKISLSMVQIYLRRTLKWSYRASTKATLKPPLAWEQNCYEAFLRLGFTVHRDNMHQSWIVNCDQTGVLLIPTASDHTCSLRGFKRVELHGNEEKHAFTSSITTFLDCGTLPAL
ncbi:hypothetical protein C7212DRAFT_210861 [Tuber magnatum]|uniref:Uncharacterized protein n=1 Tax=Tuber magnatum TaxID=42249 RepID=A0A317SLM4_9PEZI|nr:hypothetical protein C7212DRAFT_210861 [Tuber magnatum]